jgi:hypothetical protein
MLLVSTVACCSRAQAAKRQSETGDHCIVHGYRIDGFRIIVTPPQRDP